MSFLFLFVTCAFFLSPNIAHAYDPSFAWDANTESDIAGYNIYYKTDSSSAAYNGIGANEGKSPIQIPLTDLSDAENPHYTIHGLSDTESYFFVITAYDTAGNESVYSNELFHTPSSTIENTPPEVTITAPADGSSFNQNDSITFRGSAVDSEDGDISNRLSWVSSLDGVIGSGAVFSTSSLSAGTHTITVSAKDSNNLVGSATMTMTVLSPSENAPPEVTITAPPSGSSFNLNDSITFRGSAVDSEDGDISNRLSWVSNLDGIIGIGAAFSISSLSEGTHTITVSATDSDHLSKSATITVNVLSSTTSSIVIDNDNPGTSFTGSWRLSRGENYYGAQSRYSTTVNGKYTYDAPLTGSYDLYLWWTTQPNRCSAVPVEIYDNTTLIDTVTVNQQEDGGQWNPIGLGAYTFTGQAKVSIVSTAAGRCSTNADALKFVSSLSPGDTPPEVTITAPADGSSFNQNDSITFSGNAIDAEDGDISNRLSWVSNIDGVIGSGATFSTSSLSAGTHTITASAKDSGDLPGKATMTLTVLLRPEDTSSEITVTTPSGGYSISHGRFNHYHRNRN